MADYDNEKKHHCKGFQDDAYGGLRTLAMGGWLILGTVGEIVCGMFRIFLAVRWQRSCFPLSCQSCCSFR